MLFASQPRSQFQSNISSSGNSPKMLIISVNEETGRAGSVTPLTPTPRSEIKGIRLFKVISRKLANRSQENVHSTDESRSSSSESSGSTSVGHTSRIEIRTISPNYSSSSSSDSGSDVQTSRSRHHHSASADSLRNAFRNLNLYNRSQSCASTKDIKKKKEKKAQKSILRHPVSYTYVKGISGLPTQRIPRHQLRAYNACSCSMHYLNSLNH